MYIISYIQGFPVIEIDHFLTDQESDTLLASRMQCFKKASSHYPSYYRDNDRYVEDAPKTANELFLKLKNLDIKEEDFSTKTVRLNERIRFCRYMEGQSFSTHQDGVYFPNHSQASKYTFLLYLNDNFTGGETEFYNTKLAIKATKNIKPQKGKLVIFDHRIWHKGNIITGGNKYILRSDIIVNAPPLETHHQGYIWNLTQLDDTRFISCGRDTYIKVWNTDLILLNTFKIHSKSVIKVVQLDQDHLISCSRDFTLKKWNLKGEVLASIRFSEMIISIQKYHLDTIIAAGTSGTLYLLTNKLVIKHTLKIHDNWIWDIILLPGNKIISCCEDGSIHITDLITQTSIYVYNYEKPLFCMHLQDTTVYVGAKDGYVLQLCLTTQRAEKIKIHQDAIRSILLLEEIDLFTCGEDNRVISTNIHSYISQKCSQSSNFIQDFLIVKNTLYTAGYNGIIQKIKIED
ncbi:2OG-Fe(II) oxygenase [Dokdonia sp.]|uniref:2OG-Fe(II) oxygenase n=1 Tax=Dokdonia sp. TaxID=2024995 RepID=UPI0032661F0D